ncbi:Probable LRR receptor-like serine/threonine-protein kinase At1g74360 [Linum perenne]
MKIANMRMIDNTSKTKGSSSSDTVKIIRLDKTAFTHADILSATENFSERRIVGRGAFGIVKRSMPEDLGVRIHGMRCAGGSGGRSGEAELAAEGGDHNCYPVALPLTLLFNCDGVLIDTKKKTESGKS